jgi:uncharacterized protein (DUF488 family)
MSGLFWGKKGHTMSLPCDAHRTIHTIGHSTRALDDFTALLNAHSIELVVDVRRWPASRRYPHFQRDTLAASLCGAGIEYLWRCDLGGFRKASPDSPNRAWRVGAFRAYADFMMTQEFERILRDMEQPVTSKRSALMCAEAVPWRCHRQLLADAFLVRGWSVRHILDDGCHEHKLPAFALRQGTRIRYSGSTAS